MVRNTEGPVPIKAVWADDELVDVDVIFNCLGGFPMPCPRDTDGDGDCAECLRGALRPSIRLGERRDA